MTYSWSWSYCRIDHVEFHGGCAPSCGCGRVVDCAGRIDRPNVPRRTLHTIVPDNGVWLHERNQTQTPTRVEIPDRYGGCGAHSQHHLRSFGTSWNSISIPDERPIMMWPYMSTIKHEHPRGWKYLTVVMNSKFVHENIDIVQCLVEEQVEYTALTNCEIHITFVEYETCCLGGTSLLDSMSSATTCKGSFSYR